jgi:hypothetical protein
MTKAEHFEALAQRCEQATGPDGNLNKTILRALGYTWRGMDYWHSDNKRIWINPSNFTASLDAALTLVPEGWRWSLDWTQRPHYQDCGRADLYAPGSGIKPPDVCDVYAATPAIALCIAALKARGDAA